jgi:hypothetical protein
LRVRARVMCLDASVAMWNVCAGARVSTCECVCAGACQIALRLGRSLDAIKKAGKPAARGAHHPHLPHLAPAAAAAATAAAAGAAAACGIPVVPGVPGVFVIGHDGVVLAASSAAAAAAAAASAGMGMGGLGLQGRMTAAAKPEEAEEVMVRERLVGWPGPAHWP